MIGAGYAPISVAMPPAEQLEEIGALATLVDENRFSYSLDALCAWRGLPGKDTAILEEAVQAAGWIADKRKTINIAEHIHKLPAHLVGPYAEADAVATLALYEDLNPILDQEGTRAAYRLDVELLPMVHEMRRRGMRVDQDAAEQARDYCLQQTRPCAGRAIGASSAHPPAWPRSRRRSGRPRHSIAHGIKYPRTEKGNPIFKAGKTGGWPRTSTGCRN